MIHSGIVKGQYDKLPSMHMNEIPMHVKHVLQNMAGIAWKALQIFASKEIFRIRD